MMLLALLLCLCLVIHSPRLHTLRTLQVATHESPTSPRSIRYRLRARKASVAEVLAASNRLIALQYAGQQGAAMWHLALVGSVAAPEESPAHGGSRLVSKNFFASAAMNAQRAQLLGRSVGTTILRSAQELETKDPRREALIEWGSTISLSETTGMPLVPVLVRFNQHLESLLALESSRAVALAGPKATARVLTWLPLLGLVVASAMGIDIVGVFVQTTSGALALALGSLLFGGAFIWMHHLVKQASRGGIR